MDEYVSCASCGAKFHVALWCVRCKAKRDAAELLAAERRAAAIAAGLPPSYSEVPWYRRRWFVLLCALTVTPVAALLAASGRLYYEAGEGVVKPLAPNLKVGLYCLSVGWMVNLFIPQGSAGSLLFMVVALVFALIIGLRK